jgi:four helix bundle protein
MESKNFETLKIYSRSMEVADRVWTIVESWPYFAKNTIGSQFIRSVDSIASNIAEGHGRFSFKDTRLYCFYSRGSIAESKVWLRKAYKRKLISETDFVYLEQELCELHKMINGYIANLNKKIKSANALVSSNAL